MDATTTARVKALLDIDSGDTTSDVVLGRIISAVSQRIENWIDRPLKNDTTLTEEYSVLPRQRVLFLRAYPVVSITSIKIATDWKFSAATAVSTDDYHVDVSTGMVHLNFYPILSYMGNNMREAPNAVQVVYKGGFSDTPDNLATSYPAISYACEQQVIAAWRRRDQPHIKTTDIGEYGSTMEGPLQFLPDVVEALMPYRRQRFGA